MIPRDVISSLGQDLVTLVHPPELRRDPDVNGIVDAIAAEMELLDAARADLMKQIFAQLADTHIDMFERLLGLPSDPAEPIDIRRDRVLTYYLRVRSTGSGLDWEDATRQQIGTGWSYQTHITGDPTTPDANVIRITVPFVLGSDRAEDVRVRVRQTTPANTDLQVVYAEGFLLDVSNLDEEPLR